MNYSPSKPTEAVVTYLLELDRDGVVGFDAIKNAVSDRSLRTDVRNRAMTLLEFLGDRTVCQSLLPLIVDTSEDYPLRLGAAFTLGVLSCRSEINKALTIFKSSSDESTRILLTRSFWWGYTYGVPGKRLIDTMFACVQNPEEPQAVRAEAAVALGNMLMGGKCAREIFIGLVNTLADSISDGTADLKYQLVYAIEKVVHGVRRKNAEVTAVLASLSHSFQQLFHDETVVDGEKLGEYVRDVYGHLEYEGFIQGAAVGAVERYEALCGKSGELWTKHGVN